MSYRNDIKTSQIPTRETNQDSSGSLNSFPVRYGGLAQPASFNGGMFGSLKKIAKKDFWADGFYMLLWWGGTASFSRRCDLDLFTLGFS